MRLQPPLFQEVISAFPLLNLSFPFSERLEEFDTLYFLCLSSKMMELCRLKYYEELKKEKRSPHSLEAKSTTAFDINITAIGGSLQINTFEYMYAILHSEILKTRKRELRTHEFHAGIQMLLQLLYIIHDMSRSASEQTQTNAKVIFNIQYSIFNIQYSILNTQY